MSRIRVLAARTGHRGAFLLFLAVLDFCYGYSLWTSPAASRQLDLFLPWQAWGATWTAVGIMCLIAAFRVRDWWGFAAAAMVKAAWAAVMCDTWLVQGVPRGWVSAVVWGCFALTVLVVSSWPDPPGRP